MQTETKLITLDEVNELLADIVSQVPEDYVYINPEGRSAASGPIGCEYASRDGSPSCLVGHVLHRLGLPVYHSETQPGQGWAVTWGFEHPHEEHFTPEAVSRLARVQSRQDQGTPWREAIK